MTGCTLVNGLARAEVSCKVCRWLSAPDDEATDHLLAAKRTVGSVRATLAQAAVATARRASIADLRSSCMKSRSLLRCHDRPLWVTTNAALDEQTERP